MERPLKRQRTAIDPLGTDDEDELDFEPNELNQRRDPVYQLQEARARACNKLKSRFEDIFAKYEKDFTGVGDEIDLRTGELVVNNGHLQSLTVAQEFGEGYEDEGEGEDDVLPPNGTPIDCVSNGASEKRSLEAAAQTNLWEVTASDSPRPGAGKPGPATVSFMPPPPCDSPMSPGHPLGSWGYGHTQVVEPAWQVPELPQSASMSPSFESQAQRHIFGTNQTTKVTKRSLLEPRSQEGEEEDVLLGASNNSPGKKESPLIKRKFPAVGSSPNNDPGLHEMIQDVMETIADTSPLSEQSRKGTPGTRITAKSSMQPLQPGTAVKGKQEKKQASEKRRSSIGRTRATPSSRMGATDPPNTKGRGRPIAGSFPARLHSVHGKRRPKSHDRQRTACSMGGQDSSDTREDFLLDVTTPSEPARQTFYVEIKARKVDKADFFPDQDDSELDIVGEGSLEVEVWNQAPQPPLSEIWDAGKNTAGTPLENCIMEPAENHLVPETMDPEVWHEPYERNKSDLASALADVGTLEDHALQESKPGVPQKQAREQFERNIMDPSYAFSDEETMLPRRKRMNRGNLDPPNRTSLAAKDTSQVDTTATARQRTIVQDASDQRRGIHAAKTSPQPLVERDATTYATGTSKPRWEQASEKMDLGTSQVVPVPASEQQTQRHQTEGTVVEQLEQQAPEKPRPLKGRSRNDMGEDSHGPSELRHKLSPVAASVTADADDEKPSSSKPPKTAGPAPVPPSTPQSKPRSRSGRAHISRSGLVSLLSDDDDEEDEISFDLADFTPSGHHRILALRPDSHQSAMASTVKKRRVASLLFGPASTSKISKHSTLSSDHKCTKRRRRSTNTLPGSVVKVKRDSPRAPSPAVSVVQTPGGTKRRCGEDGFRCEKDFCFVCISV